MIVRRLREYIQRISLVASLFGIHLLEDPNDLFLKISQKLRALGIPIRTIRLPTPSQLGEQLYDQGQLSLSAAEFEKKGIRGKLRARKIWRQISELNMPILDSVPLVRDGHPHNILFYLTNSKPFTQSGYTERSHFILKALQNHGMKVQAVTRLGYPFVIGDFPRRKNLILDGIGYRQLRPALFPRNKVQQVELAVQMLVDEAKTFNADILHTTTDYKNAIIVSRAAQVLGIPWIYETRGELQKTWLSKKSSDIYEIASESEYYLAAESKELEAMESAAALVMLSEVSKRNAVEQGVAEDKIQVIPNAVSSSEIGRDFSKEHLRDELGLRSRNVLIGAITSIVGYEGLDDLIRAIQVLPEVDCIIVGEGESKLKLEELVAKLGLGKQIQFMGKQSANSIWKWYAALDIFVIPRKNQEVCRTVTPIKTLMAQANGVPVVASDLPALREVTGNCAVYFQSEDPQNLAHAIRDVISDKSGVANRQSERGKKWVSSRTWDSNAEKLIHMYEA